MLCELISHLLLQPLCDLPGQPSSQPANHSSTNTNSHERRGAVWSAHNSVVGVNVAFVLLVNYAVGRTRSKAVATPGWRISFRSYVQQY